MRGDEYGAAICGDGWRGAGKWIEDMQTNSDMPSNASAEYPMLAPARESVGAAGPVTILGTLST
jgi:hypothetical protein